jgi:hypothetical protein
MHLETALVATATVAPEDFGNFQRHLDSGWIEEALAATGTASLRKRRLPAEQVVWLVIGMGLYRNLPIAEVVRSLDLALPDTEGRRRVAPSAIPQARERLGDEPMQWLFERAGRTWADRSADEHRVFGLTVWGVDGSTLNVADTPDNREHFGGTNNQRGTSGYPRARVVTLMALRSHLLRGARIGGYWQSEQALAESLWEEIPDDSLTLVDRNFFGAPTLLAIARGGRNRHWLTRQRANLRQRVIRRLGPGDEIVEMEVSARSRRHDPTLPRTWQFRRIRYQRKGFRPQKLLTSLVDDKAFPASEIVALYHERWELELGYDEIKTELLERREAIRSQIARAVWQEFWGLLLAYNLVRLEMVRIAAVAGVPPVRISFVTVLRELRMAFAMWQHTSPGALPERLCRFEEDMARFVLPERRSERRYPRAVKIKMTHYPRKRPSPTRKGLN